MSCVRILLLALVACVAGSLGLSENGDIVAVRAATSVDIAIDMDTTYNNARLTYGPDIQLCGGVASGSTVDIDVVILPPGIASADGIGGYQFDLHFDPTVVNVTADGNTNQLLAQASGSRVVSWSHLSAPGVWKSRVVESGTAAPEPAGAYEIGPGVLTRITLTGVAAGNGILSLTNVILLDKNGDPIPVEGSFNATVVVDGTCDGLDVDSDGVLDMSDFCPGTPPGEPVDSLGCSASQMDEDLDGSCNPYASSAARVGWGCSGEDNCPEDYNPTQSDIDGDGIGDACDNWDADGDGYRNTTETTYASNTLNAASTPEVCDGADNDGDTLVDEGPGNPPTPFADIDGDTVPDCVDSNVDTDGDTVVNTTDTDDDGDGTIDAIENIIGTDSLVSCNDSSGLPDWPQDFDDNKVINIVDVYKLVPPVFQSKINPGGKEPYQWRRDITGDGHINILDIFKMTPPVFNSTCTP